MIDKETVKLYLQYLESQSLIARQKYQANLFLAYEENCFKSGFFEELQGVEIAIWTTFKKS